jgi:hypothetical protein
MEDRAMCLVYEGDIWAPILRKRVFENRVLRIAFDISKTLEDGTGKTDYCLNLWQKISERKMSIIIIIIIILIIIIEHPYLTERSCEGDDWIQMDHDSL